MFNIVLDTEVFRSEMLNFAAGRFKRLAELVADSQASIYLTDIVVGETRRAIAERTRGAVEYLRRQKVRRKVGYLQHCPSAEVPGIAAKIDAADASKDLNAAFDKLLATLSATIVSSDDVPVAELRRRYFGAVAPFGHRAEKKHEFPDALTFLAVEKYATDRDVEIFIVSADKGLASAAEGHARLRHVNSIREMIDLILKRTQAIAAAVDRIEEMFGEEFETRIAEQFVASGFTLVDVDGDVEEVKVMSVSDLRTYIDEVEDSVVTLNFEAEVEFTAEITYDDPDQSYRDSETGEVYVFGSIDTVIERYETVEGQAMIEINADNLADSEIRDFCLIGDFTIEVSPPEDYK